MRAKTSEGLSIEDVIIPLMWMDTDQRTFQAFSQRDDQVKPFQITGIVDLRWQDGVGPVRSEDDFSSGTPAKQDAGTSSTNPLLARPIYRAFTGPLTAAPISRVTHPEEWNRLMLYLRDCLRYRQMMQTRVQRRDIFWLTLENQLPDDFLQRTVDFQFTLGYPPSRHAAFRNMIDPANRPMNAQLFIGAAFFCDDGKTMSPLLLSPVSARFPDHLQAVLQTGMFCVNIAPLLAADLPRDEIASFLAAFETFAQAHSRFSDIVTFLQDEVSRLTGQTITLRADLEPADEALSAFLYPGTGLFWVEEHLPAEADRDSTSASFLTSLASASNWNSAPDVLLSLLNRKTIPPPAANPTGDETGFVLRTRSSTDIPWQVIRSPLTVMPGTRADLPFDALAALLLETFLDGKTALFVSPNAQRLTEMNTLLQEQLAFLGVCALTNLADAAMLRNPLDQMEPSIQTNASDRLSVQRAEYQTAKLAALACQAQIDLTHAAEKDLAACQAEFDLLCRRLPQGIGQKAALFSYPYMADEHYYFETWLIAMQTENQALIADRRALQQILFEIFAHPDQYAPFESIATHAEQWMAFKDGPVPPLEIRSLEVLRQQIHLWINMLDLLEQEPKLAKVFAEFQAAKQKSDRILRDLDETQREQAVHMADNIAHQTVTHALKTLTGLKQTFSRPAKTPERWTNRLKSRFTQPLSRAEPTSAEFSQPFAAALAQCGMEEIAANLSAKSFAEQDELLHETFDILRAAWMMQKMADRQSHYEATDALVNQYASALPIAIRKDIALIKVPAQDTSALRQIFLDIDAQTQTLSDRHAALLRKLADQIGENGMQLDFLHEAKTIFSGPERALFRIGNMTEDLIDRYLQVWRDVLACWECSARFRGLLEKRRALPDEGKILQADDQTSAALWEAAKQYLHAAWQRHTATRTQPVWDALHQKIRAWVDSPAPDSQRPMDGDTLDALLGVFPIWTAAPSAVLATFPPISERFDVVIIDQANRESLAEGIPLVYLARKVILLDDPTQPWQPPLFPDRLNQRIAAKYGIRLDAFSYTRISLAELYHATQRS